MYLFNNFRMLLFFGKYLNISDIEKLGSGEAAFLGFMALPIGYLLSIFSQMLYYLNVNGCQVHKKIVQSLPASLKNEYNYSESDQEHVIEAKMTFVNRNPNSKNGIDADKLEYLMSFRTKDGCYSG